MDEHPFEIIRRIRRAVVQVQRFQMDKIII